MKDRFKIIFLSYLCATGCALRADVFNDMFNTFDSAMRDMKKQIQQTREYAHKALRRADQSIMTFDSQNHLGAGIKFEDQGEYLKTTISLQGGGSKAADSSEIDIKGKDKSLKGTLQYGDYKVDITITDGQFINVTQKYNSKKDDSKSNGSYQRVSSSSIQSLVLPSKVDKLNKARANFAGGKLVLLLPKKAVSATKDGWSRIAVSSK